MSTIFLGIILGLTMAIWHEWYLMSEERKRCNPYIPTQDELDLFMKGWDDKHEI